MTKKKRDLAKAEQLRTLERRLVLAGENLNTSEKSREYLSERLRDANRVLTSMRIIQKYLLQKIEDLQ